MKAITSFQHQRIFVVHVNMHAFIGTAVSCHTSCSVFPCLVLLVVYMKSNLRLKFKAKGGTNNQTDYRYLTSLCV